MHVHGHALARMRRADVLVRACLCLRCAPLAPSFCPVFITSESTGHEQHGGNELCSCAFTNTANVHVQVKAEAKRQREVQAKQMLEKHAETQRKKQASKQAWEARLSSLSSAAIWWRLVEGRAT